MISSSESPARERRRRREADLDALETSPALVA
jgi:hypothetical protein